MIRNASQISPLYDRFAQAVLDWPYPLPYVFYDYAFRSPERRTRVLTDLLRDAATRRPVASRRLLDLHFAFQLYCAVRDWMRPELRLSAHFREQSGDPLAMYELSLQVLRLRYCPLSVTTPASLTRRWLEVLSDTANSLDKTMRLVKLLVDVDHYCYEYVQEGISITKMVLSHGGRPKDPPSRQITITLSTGGVHTLRERNDP